MKSIIRVFQLIAFMLMIVLYAVDYNRTGIVCAIPFWIMSVFANENSDY